MITRKPTRLPDFDYAQAGTYFVTICLRNMGEMRFGGVIDGRLVVSEAGMMVSEAWMANIKRYPGAELDAFVVMPNHLHGIVLIGADPGEPPANLNEVVATFKSVTTAEYGRGVRDGKFPPYETALWQRSYYDRILRDAAGQERAHAYIEGNPSRWLEKWHNERSTP